MERIKKLCSLLKPCTVFADVGCDHGYMTEYMLKNGLCTRAYISDISAKSLHKAEILLKPYIGDGKCVPIVCDGLSALPETPDLVLIAGLGGEETVKILRESYLPANFFFQPMKNAEKLRRYLVLRGAKLSRDFMFSDGKKYYDVILGQNHGGDEYSEREFRYGRDNLKGNPAFLSFVKEELFKTGERLKRTLKETSRAPLSARLNELQEIEYELERNL